MVAVSQRRTRPRGEVRRTEILDAVVHVFLENGYSGATIDLVVARAGASKATIYSFFGGKEGLFTAIVEERTEQVLSALLNIDITGLDVPAALTQIGRRCMDAIMAPDAIGIYRLILAEGFRFPDVVRTFYRLGPDRVSNHLAEVLRDWRERGLVVLDDPELTAIQFLDALRGGLHLRAMAGLPPDNLAAAIERNVENAVHNLWTGIRPGG